MSNFYCVGRLVIASLAVNSGACVRARLHTSARWEYRVDDVGVNIDTRMDQRVKGF